MSAVNELGIILSKLEKTVLKIEESFLSEPEGRIVVRRISQKTNEYVYFKDDSKPTYIKQSNIELISKLLQKRYNHNYYRVALKQIKLIKKFLNTYNEHELQDIVLKYDEQSSLLIDFHEVPNEAYVKRWVSEPFIPNPFPVPDFSFLTLNNEHVRSKSEVIIANCLKNANVPYKYECPLVLSKIQTFYPDFTILNKRNGAVYYWEHFGKMDSDEYRTKALKKLEAYALSDIFPGKELIITFEDYRMPLSVQVVQKYIVSLLT